METHELKNVFGEMYGRVKTGFNIEDEEITQPANINIDRESLKNENIEIQ